MGTDSCAAAGVPSLGIDRHAMMSTYARVLVGILGRSTYLGVLIGVPVEE